ncbi:MAG: hypothetical protein Kow00121_57660 [Elainellaceae cyanobacterium]
MKALIRWSTTLAIAGSILLGSALVSTPRALALTDEQVMQRLQSVPVFTLTRDEESLLLLSPDTEASENAAPTMTIFLSHENAENFLRYLKENDPENTEQASILLLSLADVYQIAQESSTEGERLSLAFVPMEDQVQAARTIIQQNGENAEEFQGVPVFYPVSAEDGSLLTRLQGEQEVIPMFLEQEQLQSWLGQIEQNQPELVNNIKVEVGSLENLIRNLQASDQAELNQIYIVPPQETVDFINESIQQGQQAPGQQAPAGGSPQQPAQ